MNNQDLALKEQRDLEKAIALSMEIKTLPLNEKLLMLANEDSDTRDNNSSRKRE